MIDQGYSPSIRTTRVKWITRLYLFPAAGDHTDNATATVHLNGETGGLRLGSNGVGGAVRLFRADGDSAVDSTATIDLDGQEADIAAGGNGASGDVTLRSTTGEDRIRLDAGGGNIWLGGNGADGDLVLFAAGGDNSTLGDATFHLNGDTGNMVLRAADGSNRIRLQTSGGNIWLGGNGADGDLVLFAAGGDNTTLGDATIHLNGDTGNMVLRAADGSDRIRLQTSGGNIWLGGNGADGDLVLFAAGGDNTTLGDATIHLNGDTGNMVLRAADGSDRIRLQTSGGNIWLGGNGADGDLVIFASSGDNTTLADATIHLNGDAGDIILRNADCAEDFEVQEDEDIEPGTVMVIGENSRLCTSRKAYDRAVAGVVAGAGACRPGIVLGRKEGAGNALPIALVGRVFCKVDAGYGVVNVGDMLTTSPSPGYAMNAAEPLKAFGAVIGKALGSLKSGKGLVPALIALQ